MGFLAQILQQRDTQSNKYQSDIERKKLNQLLSRSQIEWEEFERMDAQKENGFLPLLQEKKLPQWLDEITTTSDPKEALPEKRARKQISYRESDYWKQIEQQCVVKEEDDKESTTKNKRKRKQMDHDNDNKDDNDNKKRRK